MDVVKRPRVGTTRQKLISLLALTATPVSAETQRYSYDARGRLVASFRSDGPSAGVRTQYGFNRADNRAAVSTEFVLRWLRKGEAITSPDGRFRLLLQLDGNLVLYDDQWAFYWASGTSGSGDRAQFQVDGNLVILSAAGVPVWSANTHGHWGADLRVENDGKVNIRNARGDRVWTSH